MELFLPSFLILLLAAVIVFAVLPRFGPLVLTVLSLALLAFGMYHHWATFKHEYRLATWYDSMTFKALAPALLIGLTLVLILGFILSFFGSGVPVPAVPQVGEAIANIGNAASLAVENITETVRNIANNATNKVANAVNTAANTVANNSGGLFRPSNNTPNANIRRNYNKRNGLLPNFNVGSLANKI
jgi:hypothetical protein